MPALHLIAPEAAALALPAAAAWWWLCRRGHGRWWRALALAALVVAAMRPELAWGRGGSDVVLVLDRSASMGGARARQDELVRLAGEQRRAGDRLAVVAVGEDALVAAPPSATGVPRLADVRVRDSGSDLAAGLERAAALIPPGRSARVVLHSDGEATGFDPRLAAARLAGAGIAIDCLAERRPDLPDAAVLEVEVPGTLRLGESFIGAARLLADRAQHRGWRALRDDKTIASGEIDLPAGAPVTVAFADRPPRPGVARYRVELISTASARRRDALIARVRALAAAPASRAVVDRAAAAAGLPAPDPAMVDQALSALADPAIAPLLDRLLAGEDPHAVLGPYLAAAEAAAPPAARGALATAQALLPAVLATLDVAAVGDDADRDPLNDRANAATRVVGGERVLVVGGDGAPGNVARALEAAGLSVATRAEGPLGLEDLMGCSTLVLDQVPADRLGLPAMEAIARWVEHLGGGLVMTGGRRSFGAGGYHKSPVERVLPVTMELRDEHRKLAVAMAITLDRSGSMGAPAGGGRTKMDLADEGAVSAIEMLSAMDQVAIHAVDSAPHVVVPMTRLTDKGSVIQRIRSIDSGGGGIYVYEALLAAGKELLDVSSGTRHLVLFSDAADAEQPGDYQRLVADYVKAGITVSVVAMGSEKDCDADFLKDVARIGNGRISFAEDVSDLPRLFAQETVLVARSAWIGDPVRLRALPPLASTLGADAAFTGEWPTIAGYNLTYPRERADVLALAPGDPQAPAIASWRIGTGRAVAMGFAVDDAGDAALSAWPGYAPLLAGLVRWTAGGDERAPGALTATRAGRSVRLRLELDPAERARWPATPPRAVLASDAPGDARGVDLAPIDDGVYEARTELDDERVTLPAVDLGGVAVIGPALRLPYSPEAEPRFGRPPGSDTLAAIARATGGRMRDDLVGLFDNPPSPGELRGLATPLVALALVLLLAEIAVRRMRLGWPRRQAAAAPAPAAGPAPTVASAARAAPAAIAPAAPAAAQPEAGPGPDQGLHEALRQLKRRRGG